MISYIVIAFLIGVFVGAFIGLVVASLCVAAGDADRRLGYDELDEFPEQTDEHMAAPR